VANALKAAAQERQVRVDAGDESVDKRDVETPSPPSLVLNSPLQAAMAASSSSMNLPITRQLPAKLHTSPLQHHPHYSRQQNLPKRRRDAEQAHTSIVIKKVALAVA
jgi:hypothetical protein